MEMEKSLPIKTVAAYALNFIDPNTGDNIKNAALGVLWQKAYPVWRNENIFLPQTILTEGGTVTGAGTVIYTKPTLPKSTDYDPMDWDWTKIPKLEYSKVTLYIDNSYKVQRRYDVMDFVDMKNKYEKGEYATVASAVLGLIKEVAVSDQIRQNVLIMKNIYEQAQKNGIIEINIPRRKNTTSFDARRAFIHPIADMAANFKKVINYKLGMVGTSSKDVVFVTSFNYKNVLIQASGIVGSDKSFDSIKYGEITMIMGIPVVAVPYMDNKFSVHEIIPANDDDREALKARKELVPIIEDFTSVDGILLHRDTFVYKFGQLWMEDHKIQTTPFRAITLIRKYPTHRKEILGKLCIGFKFNYQSDLLDNIAK